MPYLPETNQAYYKVWSVERPKAEIVFLHGAGEYCGLYHRMADMLNADGYRLWMVDHIAHGFTPGNLEDVYDIKNLAENAGKLIELVRSQEKHGKIVLMGNSLGGVTAGWLMSGVQPPEICGLILTSTPLAPLQNIDRLDEAIMSKEPDYLDLLAFDPIQRQMPQLDYYKLDAAMTAAANQIKAAMPSWKIPVMFINGENDALALAKDAREWAKLPLKGRSFVIRNSYHDILNDVTYRTVTRLVSDFVFEVTNDDIVPDPNR